MNQDLSEMDNGEISIFRFMGQFGGSLTPKQIGFGGSLTVLGVTAEYITIELTIKGAVDFDIEETVTIFDLARVPTQAR